MIPPPTRFKRPQPSNNTRETRVEGKKRYTPKRRPAKVAGTIVSRLRIVNPGNSIALCNASPSQEDNVASASKTVVRPVWFKDELVACKFSLCLDKLAFGFPRCFLANGIG